MIFDFCWLYIFNTIFGYQSLVHEQSCEAYYHKLGISHACFAGCLVVLMIDISVYRFRIGIFAGGKGVVKGGNLRNENFDFSVFSPTNRPHSTKFYLYNQSSMDIEENVVHKNSYFIHSNLFMLLYLYIILIFTMITSYFVCSPDFNISISYNICPGVLYLKWDLSFITISHIKIAFFHLMFYVLLRTTCSTKNGLKTCFFVRKVLSFCKNSFKYDSVYNCS